MNKKKVKVITQKYWNLTAKMKVSTLGGNLCLHLCHLNKETTIIAIIFVFIFYHELIYNLIRAIMVGKNQLLKPSLNDLIMAIVSLSHPKPYASQSIKNILSWFYLHSIKNLLKFISPKSTFLAYVFKKFKFVSWF